MYVFTLSCEDGWYFIMHNHQLPEKSFNPLTAVKKLVIMSIIANKNMPKGVVCKFTRVAQIYYVVGEQ